MASSGRASVPRDILTRAAFENAITAVIALGGSTNAVLHLLAIAHAARVRLSLDDFTRIGKRVPVLADLKPSGRYLMSELIAIGGIRPLLKTLLDAGPVAWRLHDRERPDDGGESRATVAPYPPGQDVVRPLRAPDQEGESSGHPAGQPRARRRGGEDQRQGGLGFRGHGAGVRFRRAGAAGDPRRHACGRQTWS